MDTKIYKTMVEVGSNIVNVDTVFYENAFWLVPNWLGNPVERWQMPRYTIRLTGHAYQEFGPDSDYPADFLLNEPIPKAVLDGEKESGWIIQTAPDIRFPALKLLN